MPDPEEAAGLTTRRRVRRETASQATKEISQIVAERLATAKAAAADHKRRIESEKTTHDLQIERDRTAHTLRLEQEEATHRRKMEWAILIGVRALGGFASATCLLTVVIPGASDEVKKAALAGLFSLITAALGFLAGKGTRKD